MNQPPSPFDFLEDSEILKTVIADNYVNKDQTEFRPLMEFKKVTGAFARDFTRNYLKSKGIEFTEEDILNFQNETYGTL